MRAFKDDIPNTYTAHTGTRPRSVKVRVVQGFKIESHGTEHPTSEEHGEGTWIFSFADLIMNLLMFFVMMFAMSSVDKGKFKEFQEAISNFQDKPTQEAAKKKVTGNGTESGYAASSGISNVPKSNAEIMEQIEQLLKQMDTKAVARNAKQKASLAALEPKLKSLANMVQAEIKADPQGNAYEIIFGTQRLFATSAESPEDNQKSDNPQAVPKVESIGVEGQAMLKRLALELKALNRPLDIWVQSFEGLPKVENQLLRKQSFGRTAQQATSALIALQEAGLNPNTHKMSAGGFGDLAQYAAEPGRISPVTDRIVIRVGLGNSTRTPK